MAESVNNIQPAVTVKNDNAGRNAAIGGAVGLVGLGTVGYTTKKIFKDDKFTDEFIKEVKNSTIDNLIEDKDQRKGIKSLLSMEENPSIDKIKKFIKNNKKYFEKETGKKASDILKESDDDIKNAFITKLKPQCDILKGKLDAVVGRILDLFDKDKREFNITDDMKDSEVVKAISSARKKIKGKAGLIWGIASGAVLGAGAYIATKLNGNKQA